MNPPSQIKSLFPVLKNPANRHRAVGFTKEQFHYAFANTVSREESDAAYDRLHIPAPGNWVWAYGLIAKLQAGPPGHLGRLRPGRPCPAAIHHRRQRPPDAALGAALEREEVPQLRGDD